VLVLDLAKLVKDAAKKNGMLPWQYNTVGVSDGITMGNDGKSKSPGNVNYEPRQE
jgi:dihydroxyacid dehydratase/phosphogluconate dehydratase